MTEGQWQAFASFRGGFSKKCAEWDERSAAWLKGLQRMAAERAGVPPYPVETPVVYNAALDSVRPEDDILLIIAGDNPGKEEQLERNRKYLVGQAGKLAARFFALHPELGIDFRKNAIVLNKTPIHSARTQQLRLLLESGGEKLLALLEESELFMAEQAAMLQAALSCPLWITGYSELRKGGVFAAYARALQAIHNSGRGRLEGDSLLLFQHFSMNRFAIDLRDSPLLKDEGSLSLKERINVLGRAHRMEILGW